MKNTQDLLPLLPLAGAIATVVAAFIGSILGGFLTSRAGRSAKLIEIRLGAYRDLNVAIGAILTHLAESGPALSATDDSPETEEAIKRYGDLTADLIRIKYRDLFLISSDALATRIGRVEGSWGPISSAEGLKAREAFYNDLFSAVTVEGRNELKAHFGRFWR
jgi:hypothetical protein